jgi:hypothetical protein
MKNALISPNETDSYISSWVDYFTPVWTTIPDSQRIAEVADQRFNVAPPLYWMECADDVTAEEWYLDTATGLITKEPDPAPQPPRPNSGTQTL